MTQQNFKNIVIVGSSGAIGHAMTEALRMHNPSAIITQISSQIDIETERAYQLDYNNLDTLEAVAKQCASQQAIDCVIVCTGMLHNDRCQPEKSIKDLTEEKFHTLYQANCVLPAMVAKYFIPYIDKQQHCLFAALSARVGSISDNQLGGWYAYRAAKTALNMIIRNLAIETKRTHKGLITIGMHPGTVDSNLSEPFKNRVPANKLFTPEHAVQYLVNNVITKADMSYSGKCFDWQGLEICP